MYLINANLMFPQLLRWQITHHPTTQTIRLGQLGGTLPVGGTVIKHHLRETQYCQECQHSQGSQSEDKN